MAVALTLGLIEWWSTPATAPSTWRCCSCASSASACFAAERLADLADEENAELIVVGSCSRGAFKAAFLGSASTSLIGVARCPVLVVPPGASEA